MIGAFVGVCHSSDVWGAGKPQGSGGVRALWGTRGCIIAAVCEVAVPQGLGVWCMLCCGMWVLCGSDWAWELLVSCGM